MGDALQMRNGEGCCDVSATSQRRGHTQQNKRVYDLEKDEERTRTRLLISSRQE